MDELKRIGVFTRVVETKSFSEAACQLGVAKSAVSKQIAQLEKEVGSLKPGKLANLTVLAENPLTVDPLTIGDIRVLGTIHEGRVLPIEAN